MASSACPSEYPAPRLKEMVTAGNCPWCAMERASLCVSKCVKALSGTGVGTALSAWRRSSAAAGGARRGRVVPFSDVFALDDTPLEVPALDSTLGETLEDEGKRAALEVDARSGAAALLAEEESVESAE